VPNLLARLGCCGLSVAMTVALAACVQGQIEHYGRVTGPKTIAVPPGGAFPLADLKRVLIADGWTLTAHTGRHIWTRVCDADGRRCTPGPATRYALAGAWRSVECLHGRPAAIYDIALVDRETGGEIFTITGDGCLYDPVADFAAALAVQRPEQEQPMPRQQRTATRDRMLREPYCRKPIQRPAPTAPAQRAREKSADNLSAPCTSPDSNARRQ